MISRPLTTALLALSLGACADAAGVAGPADPPDAPAPAATGAGLDDAITRLLPALRPGGQVEGLEAALADLRSALATGERAAVRAAADDATQALAAYRAAAPDEFAPDADAVALAVAAATSH